MDFEKDNLIFSSIAGRPTNEVSVACCRSKGNIIVVPESVIHEGKKYVVTEIGRYITTQSYTKTTADKRYKTGVRVTGTESYATIYGWSGVTKVYIPSTIRVINSMDNQSLSACDGESTIESIVVGKPKFSLLQLFLEKKEWGKFMLPEGLQTIGDYAFKGCQKLTSITIPNTLKSIGTGAFKGCTSLMSITISEGVTSIGLGAFKGCTSLTSIIVDHNNKVFDSRDNCNAIIESATNTLITACQETIIPNSVTSIGNEAFDGCSTLTSIVIPNSVTSIGNEAFASCSSLTSIVIPNSVTSIGSDAFFGCSSLTAITIPNSVTRIGDDTFSSCSSLISITIPNGVTSIGSDAFFGCSSLTAITIPNSVTRIGDNAFKGCKSIRSIIIPNSVKELGKGCFEGCTNIEEIIIHNDPENVRITFIGEDDIYGTKFKRHTDMRAYKDRYHYCGQESWCSKIKFIGPNGKPNNY